MPKFYSRQETRKPKQVNSPFFDANVLLPTDQIIALAKRAGVDFGPGNAQERIRYFIKLGILPHMVRKVPDQRSVFSVQRSATLPTGLPAKVQAPVGHLPYSSVKKLIDVNRLNKKGFSYPQIAEKLRRLEEIKVEQKQAPEAPQKAKPIADAKPQVIYVQKIGAKDIDEKLKEHQEKVQKLVEEELASTLGKVDVETETSTIETKLIPTFEVIKAAQKLGVDFGFGDPQERIRHFIKLGILPHAVRKVPDQRSAFSVQRSATTTGHLPEWSIKRLLYINKLHQKGLTFEQIADKIKKLEKVKLARIKEKQAERFLPQIGVSENYIDKKLAEHQVKLDKILEEKLVKAPQTPLNLGVTPLDFKPATPFSTFVKGLAVTTTLTIFVAVGIVSGRNYLSDLQNKQAQLENIDTSSSLIGEVLAASSDTHRLYIDADTEVSGLTVFAEDITAPNVLYGAVGGTGISVSTGQRPTIGLDSSAVVTSVNTLAGDLTISGSGGTTITASGSTIKISTTSSPLTSESDTLSSVTGRGASTSTAVTLSGGLTLGGNLSLSDTNSTINLTNAGSLAFKDGTNTLLTLADQGAYAFLRLSDKGSTGDPTTCTAGDIYFNATDTTVKACTATNTWETLDNTGSAWSSLTDPTANLALSHSTYATTMTTAATTQTFWTLTGTSFTTGEILDLTGTWTATDGSDNEAIDINLTYTPPTASAGTFRGLDLNLTEGANALANTDYALKVTMDNSANTSTGTHSIYGGYFTATGKTTGTTTAVGLYASATGADNNYAAIFENGNVGIGTTSPTSVANRPASLVVYKDQNDQTTLQINNPNTGASSAVNLQLAQGTSELALIQAFDTGSTEASQGFKIFNMINGGFLELLTKTSGGVYNDALYISSTGNVGIGTTGPDAALEINHTTGDSLRLTYNDSDGSATNYTDFSLASTGALTVTGSAATLADGASAEKTFLTLTPGTITLTGPTQVTSVMDTAIITGTTIAATNATTVNDAAGLTVTAPVDSTNTTLTRSEALRINDTTSGAGTLTSLIGLYIAPQTGGATNNYGLCFDCDGTWNASTVASGIQFGTDSAAVTLYRSADNTLRTGDNLTVDLDLTVSGGDITGTGDESIDIGEATSNSITFLIDATGELILTSTALSPSTSDGNALGTTSLMWADLFLASGAVVNFNNGDVTLTHSTDILTIGGAATLTATDVTAFNCTDCLDFDDLDDSLDIDAATTITTTATTQTALTLTGTSFTTGELFDITGTWAPTAGGTQSPIDINITNNPSTSANTLRGIDLDIDDSTTLGNTIYGYYADIDATADAAQNVYGIYADVAATGGSAYAKNAYGAYVKVTTGGTEPTGNFSYGLFIDTPGVHDINFGIAIADQTGVAGTEYGLYIAGADNYAIYTAADPVFIVADNITTGDALNVSADGLTTGKAVNIASTSTAGGASGSSYVLNLSRSGANSNTAHTAYGLNSSVTNTNVTSGTNIAGYFTATGATTANYALYIPDQTDATGPNYGLYIAGADDYAIYTAADPVAFIGDNITTGNVVSISADGLTTGSALRVESTNQGSSAAGSGSSLVSLATTISNNDLLDIIYGELFDYNISNSAAAACWCYGYYLDLDDTSNLGNRVTGFLSDLNFTGTSAATSYGMYSVVSKTGATSGTSNTFAGYFTTSGDGGGTQNVYGVYTDANGADFGYGLYVDAGTSTTNYGIYVVNQTGGTTDYGLYIAGADNYAIYSGGEVYIASGADLTLAGGEISGTTTATVTSGNSFNANSITAGTGFQITATGLTIGELLDLTSTSSPTDGSTNEAIDINITHSPTTSADNFQSINLTTTDATTLGNTVYGLSNTLTLTNAAAKVGYGDYAAITSNSTTGDTLTGLYSLITHSGATSTGNKTQYGLWSRVDNDGVTDTNAATIYGAYFDALGNTGGTGSTAYGIYAAASGADNNYSVYIAPTSGGTTNVGLCFDCDGTWTSSTVASGIQFGTDANTVNLYRSGSNLLRTDDTLQVAANDGSGDFIYLYPSAGTTPRLSFRDGASTTRYCWDTVSAEMRLFSTTSDDSCEAGATLNFSLSTTNFQVNLDDTTTRTERLCHGGGSGGTGLADISDCQVTGQADFAEYYGTDGTLEAGDLVASSQEAIQINDPILGPVSKASVQKTNSAYEESIIGIISTNPYTEILGEGVFSEEENPMPVALSGRVPVKVSTENGPIKTGDFITSSSTPGVAMRATKAGRVVGMALSSFDCDPNTQMTSESFDTLRMVSSAEPLPEYSGRCLGKIVVFVNPTFYLGTNLASNGALSSQFAGSSQQVESPTPDSSQDESSTSPAPNGDGEATNSADLANQTQQSLDELDRLLDTTDLSLSTLTVIGNTNLAQTQIAGTFSQDGTLIIDYGKQINVLGSTLYLQNDPLAGDCSLSTNHCALVDIGSGKVTIDNLGNLITEGTVIAESIETEKITVTVSEGSTKTVGTSQIPANQKQVTIFTSALEPDAKILITPRTPTGGKTIYISETVDFEGFTVALDPATPTPTDIKFDWLIVNTTQVNGL